MMADQRIDPTTGLPLKGRGRPIADRMRGKHCVTPAGCWEWIAARYSNGYGSIGGHGLNYLAHRVAYCVGAGCALDSINGLVVMHSCDNRACVNPAHLSLGTNSDNMRDMQSKDRGRFPFAATCQRGHDLSATGVYVNERTGKRRCRQCHIDRQSAWERKRRAA